LKKLIFCYSVNSTSGPSQCPSIPTVKGYSLSFLKGTALDYFKLYLTDDPANKPTWLNDYELFVKELLINFGPYDMMADAKVELEQLIMKDNHKATKFLIEFYQLAELLQYNDKALYQMAYLALPKRIKDEMVHFDKPCSLNRL